MPIPQWGRESRVCGGPVFLVDAAPNIERAGVIAGWVIGPGAGLVPSITRGVLFAQGAVYRPAVAPGLPAAPASAQSWLFYNSAAGFYWAGAPVAVAPDDAFVGWVVTDAVSVIAASRQRIAVPDPDDNITVIPVGAVLAQGPGKTSYGDTAVPPKPAFGTSSNARGGVLASGLAFPTLENTRSIESATFRMVYRNELLAEKSELTADVDAAATVFPVANGAAFTAGALYLIDNEVVKVESIAGNSLTVARGQLPSTSGVSNGEAAAHAGPKTITNATNATPIVVTTSAPHLRPNDLVVGVSGVTGNLAANSAWVSQLVTSTTMELKGSSGSGAYASGGTLAAAKLYALDERVETVALQPEFFGTPASGKWAAFFELPSVEIAVIECWVTNAFGDSPHEVLNYLGGLIDGFRTLLGAQFDLEVEGTLGILSDAVPEILMPFAAAVDVFNAYLKDAAVGSGSKVTCVVKKNGAAWAAVTILAGVGSGQRPGRGFTVAAGDKVGLDLTSVGSDFGGGTLVVRVKL